MIDISSSAQTYLQSLLAKQEDAGVAIRIFVAQPGTPQAETCIAYCRPGEEQEGDIAVEYEGFRAWFEGRSEPYLEDAQNPAHKVQKKQTGQSGLPLEGSECPHQERRPTSKIDRL